MKKIAFITIHIGANFGSNLQTIATNEVLKKLGCDPVCINYIPPRVTFKRFSNLGQVSLIRRMARLILKIYYFPLFIINRRIYRIYLEKYCHLSKPIYNSDDFRIKCPQADYYITGSDQCWNFYHNEGYDGHYFFDGIEGKKVSYATSIGSSELSEEEISIFRKYLSEYKALSVRESSAQQILQNLGFKVEHLIDPTLMLTLNEWQPYMSKRLINGNYLLAYLPYNIVDKSLIFKTIRIIADKMNLKVVTFSWNYTKDKYADKTIRFANPGDFLSLMYYAEIIVTNSFHGTVFSLNLNKVFWVYMPSSFSTRIESILKMCGLENRLLEDVIEEERLDEAIDYSDINEILGKERVKAESFLKKALDI